MKSRLSIYVIALVAAMGILAAMHPATKAVAQEAGSPIIIVIDTQKILRESKAVRSIQKKIGEQRATCQDELKDKETALRQEDEALRRQSTIISPDAFSQRKRDLEKRVGALQREIQEKRRALDKVFSQGMQQVQAALVEITKEIAKARKADLVLQRTMVVFVHPKMEITEEALAKLNANLPSVNLPPLQN